LQPLNIPGPDRTGYYHEFFLRGKRFLTKQILRIKIKGNGTRKPSSPETEPNFYVTRYLPLKEENDESNKSSPSKNGSVSPGNTALIMDDNDSIPFHNFLLGAEVKPIDYSAMMGRVELPPTLIQPTNQISPSSALLVGAHRPHILPNGYPHAVSIMEVLKPKRRVSDVPYIFPGAFSSEPFKASCLLTDTAKQLRDDDHNVCKCMRNRRVSFQMPPISQL
jgi:hypothetical protein